MESIQSLSNLFVRSFDPGSCKVHLIVGDSDAELPRCFRARGSGSSTQMKSVVSPQSTVFCAWRTKSCREGQLSARNALDSKQALHTQALHTQIQGYVVGLPYLPFEVFYRLRGMLLSIRSIKCITMYYFIYLFVYLLIDTRCIQVHTQLWGIEHTHPESSQGP